MIKLLYTAKGVLRHLLAKYKIASSFFCTCHYYTVVNTAGRPMLLSDVIDFMTEVVRMWKL